MVNNKPYPEGICFIMPKGRYGGFQAVRHFMKDLDSRGIKYHVVLGKDITPELVKLLVELAPKQFDDLFIKQRESKREKISEAEQKKRMTPQQLAFLRNGFTDLTLNQACEWVSKNTQVLKTCILVDTKRKILMSRIDMKDVHIFDDNEYKKRRRIKELKREILKVRSFDTLSNDVEEDLDTKKTKKRRKTGSYKRKEY